MPYHIMKAKGKDAYYVYDVDGKRHSNEPMELSVAKKQLAALNMAHAKKADIPTKVRKASVKVIEEFPGAKTEHKYKGFAKKTACAVEAARKFASEKELKPYSRYTESKTDKAIDKAAEIVDCIHSPDGMLSPVVSETTGGGSGLANDKQFVEAPYRRTNAHIKNIDNKK